MIGKISQNKWLYTSKYLQNIQYGYSFKNIFFVDIFLFYLYNLPYIKNKKCIFSFGTMFKHLYIYLLNI